MGLADEDIDSFLDSVSEVSRLVDGLKAGTIPPDYVDRKLEERHKAKGRATTQQQQPEQERDQQDEQTRKKAEAKQAELERKVGELKANRARKLRARQRFEERLKQQSNGIRVRPGGGTDYATWDMWCPSDEEDDLFNSLTPSNPAFRAMEKEIDERHKRMVEQRQFAESHRIAGNAAFRAGQWSEALRCYEEGLEAQRHNMALHANAAAACLKLRCFVQALEHCDRMLHIAEVLHNDPRHALCVKALERRASAHQALEQHSKAVEDLQAALEVAHGDAELLKQLQRARRLQEEQRQQKRLRKAMGKTMGDDSARGTTSTAGHGGETGFDVGRLQQVERLCKQLHSPSSSRSNSSSATEHSSPGAGAVSSDAASGPANNAGSSADAARQVQVACTALQQLLAQDDACCMYFRECGGLDAAAQQLKAAVHRAASATSSAVPVLPARSTKPTPGRGPVASSSLSSRCSIDDLAAAVMQLINTACANDTTLERLPELGVLDSCLQVLGSCLPSTTTTTTTTTSIGSTASGSGGSDPSQARQLQAAVLLLSTASTNEAVRQQLCKRLAVAGKDSHAGGALAALMAATAAAAQWPTGLQVAALALLGNVVLSQPVRSAFVKLLHNQEASLQALLDILGSGSSSSSSSSSSSGDAGNGKMEDPGTRCSSAPDARSVEVEPKKLALLGNLCSEAQLRALLATQQQLLLQLAERSVGVRAPAGVQDAALSALFNLCLEPAAQEVLATGLCSTHLAALLQAAARPSMFDAAGAAANVTTAARAAGIVARVAKHPQGASALGQQNAAAQLLQALSAHHQQQNSLAAEAAAAAACWLDAAVRAVAQLTVSGAFCNMCSADVATAGIHAMVATLTVQGAAESLLGNAALSLSHFAAQDKWHEHLQQADAVAALLRVAHAGKGNTASKNAAVALARMAKHPPLMERLRELHGIEIIYQYVKP